MFFLSTPTLQTTNSEHRTRGSLLVDNSLVLSLIFVFFAVGSLKGIVPRVSQSRIVNVSVTVNFVDYSSDDITFQYLLVDPPNIVNAFPRMGPMFGGTFVTVTGAGFSSGDVVCALNGKPMSLEKVYVLSSSLLICVTPSSGILFLLLLKSKSLDHWNKNSNLKYRTFLTTDLTR